MKSLLISHLETCPDRSSTLPKQYVVPVAGASRSLSLEPEEIWEAGTPATYEAREPPVSPVFRQVHGLRPVERRLYYCSLFQNGPPENYAPPKQPKAQHRILCSNQPTNAVGAQAAFRETILNSANWPSCTQASQDQTSQTPSRKSWALKVATTMGTQIRSAQANHSSTIELRSIHARQPLEIQYQDGHPWSVLAVQDNQSIGCQASPTPLQT
ncbi:hypothetical protein MRX96_046615 [Rhipicephalus microplus]